MRRISTVAAMAVAAMMACALEAKEPQLPGFFNADYDAALKEAQASGRPLFAFFTGSDWCGWCKKLVREVFSQAEFADFATNGYTCAVIDFPSDASSQTEAMAKRNAELQEKFGVEGFPSILVIDPASEKELHRGGYESGGAVKWVASFKHAMEVAPLREKYLEPAKEKFTRLVEKMQREMEAGKLWPPDKPEKAAKIIAIAKSYASEAKAIVAKLEAEEVPQEIAGDKKFLIEGMGGFVKVVEELSAMDEATLMEKMGK